MEGAYKVHNSIQMLEARFLQDPRIHIILEMPVVEWQTYAIETQARKKLGVVFGEEVLEEFVEEEIIFLSAENLKHCFAVLVLVAWITRAGTLLAAVPGEGIGNCIHEVFHVHPSAQSCSAQNDGIPIAIDNLLPFDSEESI